MQETASPPFMMLLFFYVCLLPVNELHSLTAQLDDNIERNSADTSERTSGKTRHCYDLTFFPLPSFVSELFPR